MVQHGGDWPGQHSGFLFVPERNFGISMLTNSEDGPKLLAEFFLKDWALSEFAGVHNVPAPANSSPTASCASTRGGTQSTRSSPTGWVTSRRLASSTCVSPSA